MKRFYILLLCLILAQLAFHSALAVESEEVPLLRRRQSRSSHGPVAGKVAHVSHDVRAHKQKALHGLAKMRSFVTHNLMLVIPAYQLWIVYAESGLARIACFGLSIILGALYILFNRNKSLPLSELPLQFLLVWNILNLGYILSFICAARSYYWPFVVVSMLAIAKCMSMSGMVHSNTLTSGIVANIYIAVLVPVIVFHFVRPFFK